MLTSFNLTDLRNLWTMVRISWPLPSLTFMAASGSTFITVTIFHPGAVRETSHTARSQVYELHPSEKSVVSYQIRWPIFLQPNILDCWNFAWIISHNLLTHWGRDKMAAISQTTFSSAFSWMQTFEFWIKFHWDLFAKVQLTTWQHWFK